MSKFIQKAIPIIILLVFIVVMLSGNYLKRPLSKEDNLPQAIQIVMKNVSENRWEEASKNTEALGHIWTRIIKRVQYSSERDEINALSTNIARLNGAILSRDKSSALIELSEAHEHWVNLGR
ncbi:DUF4363 family protein [Clostridium malenominatum]|uniref:DUF4363 family protein n=1 Tax=Clostridium malenominatum TaxID=1539 RepID=A0ABN1J3B1_9CLOT